MLVLDDFSRFVVGFGLFTEATMSHAIITLRKAIKRYGKPESLLTDKGMQFYSWRTMGRFQKLLESLNIEHILARAHHPQTLGKVEALNKRIQNEMLVKKHFRSQLEVDENIRAWVYDYNHNRTHQGIKDPELGSVIVPADRYYGREEEVLAKVRARLEGKKPTPIDYTADIEHLNPFEILRVVETSGKLDIWFCGKRYSLTS
jgi:transposase InsO family protein